MTASLSQLLAERYGFAPKDFSEAFGFSEGTWPSDWPDALSASAVETLTGLLGRSTCRRFKPDPLPEGMLEMLLACAQSAPSKSDLQQYSIIVVESPEARAEIAGWMPGQPWVAQAPVFLVFCGDMHRNRMVCEMHERPHANNNQDTFMNAAVDCGLAMGAFILAAEAAGLGTCPISALRNNIESLTHLLGLPDGVFPVAGLCLGWPEVFEARSPRLPPSVVIHRDRYGDGTLREAVDDYDRRRHALKPLPPEKQKNSDVYGVSDPCPWSDQVSRQLSLPERSGFGAFLRKRGFEPKERD